MNKKDNVAMVPKYRFPEFSESWDIIPILNIGDVYKGGIFSKSDIDQNASIPCIHYGELFTKYNEVISIIYSKTNKKEGFKSKIGDILMPSSDVTPDGLAKASAIMLEDVILGGDMNIIRPNKKFNSIFISYLLNKSKKEIIKLVSGTTIKHIYPCQIITCQLPIANNSKEQQKIADCLSSIDDLISAEEKKLLLLNDYKKGWMQKLFPAEGKTVPEWRFPEFKDSEGWEKLNIKKACYPSYSGGTPVTSKKEYYNGDIPFIRSGEIGKEKTELFLTSEGLDNSSAKMIEKGDVLMALYGANSGDVAISPIKGAINQAILCLRHKNNNAFLYHYLAFKKNWIVRTYIQGGQGNLSGEIVKSIELCSPQEPDEQNRIAAFLSVIDELTSNQKEKIEALKQHKTALMQGLFPSIEEVCK